MKYKILCLQICIIIILIFINQQKILLVFFNYPKMELISTKNTHTPILPFT